MTKMRQCVVRECLEEIGLSELQIEYIGLMRLNMVPDYFSAEHRVEYGGLYGVRLQMEDLSLIENYRSDREEIEQIALLGDIRADEQVAEIDRALLNYYKG